MSHTRFGLDYKPGRLRVCRLNKVRLGKVRNKIGMQLRPRPLFRGG